MPGVNGVLLCCQHRVEQQGQLLKILLGNVRLLPISCAPELLNKPVELVVCPSPSVLHPLGLEDLT